MVDSQLPAGFDALEPFVARFAVADTAGRAALRSASSAEERAAFYAAAKDLVAPALELLDGKPLAGLDRLERRLLDLVLTYAHIAIAVEIHGSDEPQHARMRDRMRITRSPADQPA